MSGLSADLFRGFDIRGAADAFSDDGVRDLGKAIASELIASEGRRVVVGRDARVESQRLRNALVDGLVEQGLAVVDLGVVPTPLVWFAEHHLNTDGAVQISGSHMPVGRNGFKVSMGQSTLTRSRLRRLWERMDSNDFDALPHSGTVDRGQLADAHLQLCLANLRPPARPFRVVVDGGQGVGGLHCVTLLRELGCEVIPVLIDQDGMFPVRGPDPAPQHLSLLRTTVLSTEADLGIALDGDADRLVAMDETGTVLQGDRLLLLFAKALLSEHPNAAVVGEVKCSQVLFDEIRRKEGRPILSPVGHSFIREWMTKSGALLGGELSGHYYFADRHPGFDDAFYAAGRLLELMSESGRTLSGLAASLPHRETAPDLALPVRRDQVDRFTSRLASLLRERQDVVELVDADGVRVVFDNEAWALVRASQTSDAVIARFETRDRQDLQAIQHLIADLAAKVMGELGEPG